jgi:hypothetical protein
MLLTHGINLPYSKMTRNRSGKALGIIRRPANIRQTRYPRLSNPKGIAEFRKEGPSEDTTGCPGERTIGRMNGLSVDMTRGRVKDSHE